MNLRRRHIKKLAKRSWKRLVWGEVILMQATDCEEDGFLNAAKKNVYKPTTIPNCDIQYNIENKETDAGVEIDADAVVFIRKSSIEGIEISSRDRINIGGYIKGDQVVEGQEFVIRDMDDNEFFMDEALGLKIYLEKRIAG